MRVAGSRTSLCCKQDSEWHSTCEPGGVIDGINTVGNDIQAYLNLLSLRQKLTASNIANADTPGYKTRDIDFQAEFAAALQGDSSPRVLEVSGLAVKNDGNNVSLDREARMLAETALRFNLGVQLLKGEIEDIRKAIRSDSSL
jgi:flagellar basal-body rod protein FlgB